MSVHVGRELTGEIVAVLEAGGLTVGRGEAPGSVPAGSGYAVVYPFGGTLEGDLDDPQEDANVTYQVGSFGSDPQQTEWVSDRVRVILLAAEIVLSGRVVQQIEQEYVAPIVRDDDVQPPVWAQPNLYRIWTVST